MRGQEVVKIYARQHSMTQKHVDVLWDCTNLDETSQVEVYKVLQDTAAVLDEEILEMFINKIKDLMEPSKTTAREVEFIYTVGKNAHSRSMPRR